MTKRLAADFVTFLVVATGALGIVLVVHPFGKELALKLYVLLLGGSVMHALVRITRTAVPSAGRSPFDAALRTRPREERRVAEVVKLEREVSLSLAQAYDLHYRLRPTLREIARARLSMRSGIDLDSPAAAAVLGEDAWELLRPDREPPEERGAPGISRGELSALVDRLEMI